MIPDAARRWINRAGGMYLIGAALACGVLSWLPLHLLAGVAADPPYPASEIPELVRSVMRWRSAVPLLALPALGVGILLMTTKRRAVLLVSVGTILLLAPVVLVGYCFVRLVGPMYQIQPL